MPEPYDRHVCQCTRCRYRLVRCAGRPIRLSTGGKHRVDESGDGSAEHQMLICIEMDTIHSAGAGNQIGIKVMTSQVGSNLPIRLWHPNALLLGSVKFRRDWPLRHWKSFVPNINMTSDNGEQISMRCCSPSSPRLPGLTGSSQTVRRPFKQSSITRSPELFSLTSNTPGQRSSFRLGWSVGVPDKWRGWGVNGSRRHRNTLSLSTAPGVPACAPSPVRSL